LVTGTGPSTRDAVAVLGRLTERPRALVVLERTDSTTWLSLRNVHRVHLIAVDQLNTYDVLASDDVVFTRGAFDALVTRVQASDSRRAAARRSSATAGTTAGTRVESSVDTDETADRDGDPDGVLGKATGLAGAVAGAVLSTVASTVTGTVTGAASAVAGAVTRGTDDEVADDDAATDEAATGDEAATDGASAAAEGVDSASLTDDDEKDGADA
jgi:hypothetical protein